MTDEEDSLLTLMKSPDTPVDIKAIILETYIAEHGPLPDEVGEKVREALKEK